MVVNDKGNFCELQVTMDLLGHGSCFKKENHTVHGDQAELCCKNIDKGEREETVETLQSAFLKFKWKKQVCL